MLKPRLWHRLTLNFLLQIALLIVVGAYGAYGAHRLATDMEETASTGLSQIRRAQLLQTGVSTISTAARDLLLLDEAKQLRRQQALIDQALQSAHDVEVELRQMNVGGADAEKLQALFQEKEKFTASVAKFRTAQRDGTVDDARQVLVMDMRPAQAAYQRALEDMVQHEAAEATRRSTEGTDLARMTVLVTSGLVAAAVLLGSLAAIVIARSILLPVRRAKMAVETIAAGDLSTPIQGHVADEIGEMLDKLEQMRSVLAGVVTQVSHAAARIDQDSSAISDGNDALATRTSRTGGSLQQTAASVDQIASALQGTTQLTVEAAGMAEGARVAASAGGEAVHTVISTMQSIASSSARIGDIIAVIDGIAFQTNILALNAAVEAARAGEHGKGFAVVSSEVRALAGRSAQAAREVRHLIQTSSEHVEAGNTFVSDAGKKIDNVIAKVNAVSQLLERIAAAADEQTKGVEQVSGAMYEVDQSTRQNGGLVVRLGDSVQALKDSARDLSTSVSFFQTAGAHDPVLQ
ncbi:hypothetical protein A4W93_06625 [Piscinibacter gummiphilus]|uniref:Chemotaxis protein n=2 Tax=Piscinibacter gummiphilus TaxID=946333 RepID=A0A1W6L603_9BURK|nr:hypothetical protein A4W93_06625 [Piscinibacter gummiphilus]